MSPLRSGPRISEPYSYLPSFILMHGTTNRKLTVASVKTYAPSIKVEYTLSAMIDFLYKEKYNYKSER